MFGLVPSVAYVRRSACGQTLSLSSIYHQVLPLDPRAQQLLHPANDNGPSARLGPASNRGFAVRTASSACIQVIICGPAHGECGQLGLLHAIICV